MVPRVINLKCFLIAPMKLTLKFLIGSLLIVIGLSILMDLPIPYLEPIPSISPEKERLSSLGAIFWGLMMVLEAIKQEKN